jgi:hypothetical protein
MILHGWPESLTGLEKYTCIEETVTTVQSFRMVSELVLPISAFNGGHKRERFPN